MTNGLALIAHWSVRQKLNRVSSVQLYCSLRAFMKFLHKKLVDWSVFSADPSLDVCLW